jgi:hypothetical protein
MASRIKAIATYRPRVVRRELAGMKQLVGFISRSTGLNESGITQVLLELRDAVTHFALQGRPVKLEGLGIYSAGIALDGTFTVGHRPDKHLKAKLNAPGAFEGEISNREYVGMTGDELVALWNEKHPEDPVVI